MEESAIKKLAKNLGLEFKNLNLLREALTHRSYLNEHQNINWHHNERLEFLGDAVLELAVTDYLFKNFPETPEGILTNFRAALVNSNSLSEIAQKLDLEKYLLLSKGEKKNASQKGHQYILANALEALIGAIYLDLGYEEAEKFIQKNIISNLSHILETESWRDPKSLFQEKAQAKVGITPTYKVLREWGPDHNKQFITGVFLGHNMIAQGQGSSKQEAEVEAAKNALKIKRKQGW